MASLYLEDILRRNSIDPRRTKLVRHSLNHKRCKVCYNNNFIDEYQKIQSKNFYDNCEFVLSFINEPGTSAKFIGCYNVGDGNPINKSLMAEGFPAPEMFLEDKYYFDLQSSEKLSDLKDRLIIDWGRSTVSWHQWATNEKVVLAIQANPKFVFPGYDKVLLNYAELKEIIYDKVLYENWHTALSSIYAIYLIVDTLNGKQYIGSAYGKGGLLSRWNCYVNTGHAGNQGIKEILNNYTERYQNFQFSVLQILPKTITEEEVIAVENLYKSKLRTREFGMNRN